MTKVEKNALAALLVLQTLLFVVPMVVLGSAIGWPASLRLPADQALPLIHANVGAVLVGYWTYLAVSAALIPLAFAMKAWFAARGFAGWAMETLAFVGAAAGVLKTLGIVRWLSAMPTLAAQHAAADPAGQAAIEVAYVALNAYAGSVGELLGVQLMSGLWLLGIGFGLVAAGLRRTGAVGAIAGALFLATCLRTAYPPAAVLQSIAVPLTLVWFLFAAVAVRRA